MQLVIPEPSPYDRESDEDLLLFSTESCEIERRLATNAFFRRYAPDLYRLCRKQLKPLGSEVAASDLVIKTFQRAFERADSYDSAGINGLEDMKARTISWLATIAKNLIRDWLKRKSENHPLAFASISNQDSQIESRIDDQANIAKFSRYVRLADDAVDRIQDADAHRDFIGNEDDGRSNISAERECLRLALASLSERERDVLLVSSDYSVDERQLRLPSDVLHALCTHWKTNKANIRAIRKRGLAKVKMYVANNCNRSI